MINREGTACHMVCSPFICAMSSTQIFGQDAKWKEFLKPPPLFGITFYCIGNKCKSKYTSFQEETGCLQKDV